MLADYKSHLKGVNSPQEWARAGEKERERRKKERKKKERKRILLTRALSGDETTG